MMKTSLVVTFLLFTELASAAGGHHDGVPGIVTFQVINFVLFFGFLVYVLRGKVVDSFANRNKEFHSAKIKAEKAQKEAAEELSRARTRLAEMKKEEETSLVRAKEEADKYKASMIAEAEEMSAKIKKEAEAAAANEVEKARAMIRAEVLTSALDSARELVKVNLADTDQKRLQSEFVDKIQVVRP